VAKVGWCLGSSSLGVNVDRAVFGTMVGFIAMVHAYMGLNVDGPLPRPRSLFEASPRWLLWGGH
jgi:hypothetical protein